MNLALASKRSLLSLGSNAAPPAKRLKTASSNEMVQFVEPEITNLFIPVDIMRLIFVHIFDELPIKRTMQDPLLKYQLVCREWLNRLKSIEFTDFKISHPRFALLMLKIRYDMDNDFNHTLLQVASPIVDISVAMRLLLTAKSLQSIIHLSTLPVFLKEFSKKAYNLWLRFGYKRKFISHNLLPKGTRLGSIKRRERKYFCVAFSSISELVLDKIPTVDILKLFFLEHVYKPGNWHFSLIYDFIADQINMAYESGAHELAEPLIQGLNITLPKSLMNGLFYILGSSMFIACYTGDRGYFSFLNINLPVMIQNTASKNDQEVLSLFDSFVKGDIEEYPADQLEKVKDIVKFRKVFGYRGFSFGKIKSRRQAILNDPTTPAHIKAMVHLSL